MNVLRKDSGDQLGSIADPWAEVHGSIVYIAGTPAAKTNRALDTFGATTDTTDLDATTLKHGLMSKLDKIKLDAVNLASITDGDMLKATYDPTNINASAFALSNHTGTLATSQIADSAITLAKMANTPTATMLGRVTAGTGVVEYLTASQVRTLLGLGTAATTDATAYATAAQGTAADAAKVKTDHLTVTQAVDLDAIETASHAAATLAGTPNYITLAGQQLTLNQIDLATDVTGVLPHGNLGTGGGGSSKFLREDGTFQTIGGGGDALVASTLDQFADVTQTGGATLAIGASTTLSGGTHSGTNTGDQDLSGYLLATAIDTLAELNAIVTDATLIDTADSRLSDARTPTSHTHGNITNAGAIGSTASLPIKTGTSGVLEAGAFGTGAGQFAEGNHTHAQLHDALTMAGTPDYATLAGQILTLDQIDLAADVTGVLPHGNLGTGGGGSSKFLREDGTFQTIAAGGDAVTSGTLDQFADVTQTGGATLAIGASTTLSGGTHSGTNTGDQTPTSLGLIIGTHVQAYDADLTTWAAITPGTGVATALAVNVGTAGAPVVLNGVGGTPSSITLTNATGLPVNSVTGITAAAQTVLDDTTVSAMVDTLGGAGATGTGGLVRTTSPTLVTPLLGTPTSGVLTNCTGLKIGSTSGLPIKTGTSGALEAGAFGTTAGTFAEGNHAAFKVAILSDVKAYNANGGTFTSGADRTRDLNTESDPDSIVSLTSNAFTPVSGTYLIEWSAPGYAVDRHWSKLWNKTTAALVKMGSAVIANSTGGNTLGFAIVTCNGTDEFEIRHRCQASLATYGFGVANNVSGDDSIYTQVTLTKLS